jgi:hypothetical protein
MNLIKPGGNTVQTYLYGGLSFGYSEIGFKMQLLVGRMPKDREKNNRLKTSKSE